MEDCMKKIWALMALAALLVMPPVVGAVGNHTMSGCGLAYLLFSSKSNQRGPQIFASTTNGLFGNQTFGITSGTLGCTPDGKIAKSKEVQTFAETNLEQIRFEMARGEGAFVTAFASLLGASEKSIPSVVKFFNEEYANLFPKPETTAQEMLDVLDKKITERPGLLS